MNELSSDMLARLNEILKNDFVGANELRLPVTEQSERVPLVKATVCKSSRSFSVGQKVHIYDVYWGMNEKALVVARYRRKHEYILGVIPIKNLEGFRPDYVYHPAVLQKLRLAGKKVDSRIFGRFFTLPHQLSSMDYQHFLHTGALVNRSVIDTVDSSLPASVAKQGLLERLLTWLGFR